jgi:hypothetical protein
VQEKSSSVGYSYSPDMFLTEGNFMQTSEDYFKKFHSPHTPKQQKEKQSAAKNQFSFV